MSDHWLDQLIHSLADNAPPDSFFAYGFNIRALLALILVSIACGSVGSLVVGSRMAFFSDALAHVAFASVSIGFVFFTVLLVDRPASEFWDWVTPLMLIFGILVGYGIAAVRQRTGLGSDTVIGIFFAASIGLAAMLRKVMQARQLFSLEDFLFGDPLLVRAKEIIWLALLVLVTLTALTLMFNSLLLAGFNSSLALSRRVRVQVVHAVFIVLLAMIVNLCLRTVGALLINALLVVPAATALNLSRNLRQMFWVTIVLCLVCSIGGQFLSWEVEARTSTRLGIPGTIILLSVFFFALSVFIGPRLREQRTGQTA